MIPDIKRATELAIVQALKAALPDSIFVPYSGGSRTEEATEMEPPFTVVAVTEAEKTMATEGTWLCSGTVQIITYFSETPSEQHSELSRDVYKALDSMIPSPGIEFSLHGVDVSGMTSAIDEAESAHADIITFTAGVGG